MIPTKLAELAYAQKLLLILPIILVPILAVMLTRSEPAYRSSAAIWVTDPPDTSATLGYRNQWNTPAQNQATILTDLLSTTSFRLTVAEESGLVAADAPQPVKEEIAARMTVWAASTGVNLLHVAAESASPTEAAAIVQAVLDNYSTRATEGNARELSTQAGYYERQVALAREELNAREAALSQYVAATAETLDPEYQTLLASLESQRLTTQELETKLQDVRLRLHAAPETLEATFAVQDPPSAPRTPLAEPATTRFGIPLAGVILGALVSASYLYLRYRRTTRSSRSRTSPTCRYRCWGRCRSYNRPASSTTSRWWAGW